MDVIIPDSVKIAELLIVLNGIEIFRYIYFIDKLWLLIVLNGIEMTNLQINRETNALLIVLNGIEICLSPFLDYREPSFNRTKWN